MQMLQFISIGFYEEWLEIVSQILNKIKVS